MTDVERACDDEGIVFFVAANPVLLRLISSLVDDDECRFDHHGGCQAHGFLSLEPGEMCPNEEAKRLVEQGWVPGIDERGGSQSHD